MKLSNKDIIRIRMWYWEVYGEGKNDENDDRLAEKIGCFKE